MSDRNPVGPHLQIAAERLYPLYPPPVSLRDDVRMHADAAVDGQAVVYYLGEQRFAIGRRNTDWLMAGHDIEVRAFVYGMPFIDHLTTAFHVTRDERYAQAARDFLVEFMHAFPQENVGQNHDIDSTLTVAGRNAVWARCIHLLASSEAFDDALLSRMIDYMAVQFDFLQKHIKPVINWRISEARAILMGGLYLSSVPRADEWRRFGVRVLNDAWHRQFLPDGVHSERTPTYHLHMADTFRDLYRLGRLLPELGLTMSIDGLAPMYDFALACTKPSGYLCGIHDSQSEFTGRLGDGRYTAGHKAIDGAKSRNAFRKEFGLPAELPPTTQIYPHAAFAFMRSGWDEDAAWLSFDATNWGSGHCHLSRNAVQLHAHRQSMVIDPGWLDYTNTKWGLYGRSTRAHATCNLDGLNQSSTDPRTFMHFGAPGYDAVLGVYEGGYWDTQLRWNFTHARNGIWAEHARIMFRVQDRFVFVADSMFRLPQEVGDAESQRPSYECVWPLAPGATVELDEQASRAMAQWTDAGLLMLVPIRPEGSRFEVHEGEDEPPRGWVPGEGAHVPAPQVVLNTPTMHRQHEYYVTVLIPYAGAAKPEVTVEAKSPMGQTGFVRLTWADGSQDTIYWACNFNMMLGKWPDFETDGSLVHVRKDAAGEVLGGCCVDGTYLEPFCDRSFEKPTTFAF